MLLAELEEGFGFAVKEVVAVLDAGDGRDGLGFGELGGGDFGKADVADFAGVLGFGEGAEGVGEGNGGVDAVELVEGDAVEFEAAEGELDLLGEVVGTAEGLGFRGALAGKAAFGGDDEAGGVGVKGFGDQIFGDAGAVGVGGVEEVDAEFDAAAKEIARVFAVGGLAPGAFADEAHGAVAEAVDGEVVGDTEDAGGGGVGGNGHAAVRCGVRRSGAGAGRGVLKGLAVDQPVELGLGEGDYGEAELAKEEGVLEEGGLAHFGEGCFALEAFAGLEGDEGGLAVLGEGD